MPGTEGLDLSNRMETEGLTEEELFATTEEEKARIRNGAADYIAREEKQRVLDGCGFVLVGVGVFVLVCLFWCLVDFSPWGVVRFTAVSFTV